MFDRFQQDDVIVLHGLRRLFPHEHLVRNVLRITSVAKGYRAQGSRLPDHMRGCHIFSGFPVFKTPLGTEGGLKNRRLDVGWWWY